MGGDYLPVIIVAVPVLHPALRFGAPSSCYECRARAVMLTSFVIEDFLVVKQGGRAGIESPGHLDNLLEAVHKLKVPSAK